MLRFFRLFCGCFGCRHDGVAAFNQVSLVFPKEQIEALARFPLARRKLKVKQIFSEVIQAEDYIQLDSARKYQAVSALKAELMRRSPKDLVVGIAVGALAFSLLSSAIPYVGGFIGVVMFLLCAYLGYQSQSSRPISLFMRLLDSEASSHRAAGMKLLESERKQAQEDLIHLQAKAKQQSQALYDEIRSNPRRLSELIDDYKDNVYVEIADAGPGDAYLRGKISASEFNGQVMAGAFGIITEDYVPASDPKYGPVLEILNRERDRFKSLADECRLPFKALDFYQEISRTYYGLHRPGGNASIYDEQMITNEVMALKESLHVAGNYNDNTVRIDRSVSHTTNIQSATIDSGDYTVERIKKEIIKCVMSSADESASRLELMSVIPVKESRLLVALEELQARGLIVIGNRPNGEIIYKVDRLG